MRQTRGSETSQYPEEEKSNEILLVAASERGIAQTDPNTKQTERCLFCVRVGVVGPRYGTECCSRRLWKGLPKVVTVQYAKRHEALWVS
jgi:hypothetical protein